MKRIALAAALIAATALLAALAAPARAGFDAGMAAYARDDFETARREWRRAAVAGDARAQRCLGELHYEGLGVAQDFDAAARWVRLAAEGGNADAQSRLGDMYRYGLGVRRDPGQAVAWYGRAAEQDHPDAAASLAVMYADPPVVRDRRRKARALFLRAARQGHAGAMISLGRQAWNDRVQAFKWFDLAAGRATGEDRRGAIRSRDMAAARMTPAEIAEARKLARRWLEAHAEAMAARDRTQARCSRNSVKPRIYVSKPLKPGERTRIRVIVAPKEMPTAAPKPLPPPPWERK